VAGPRADKIAAVAEVRDHLERADAAILTEYRGLKVADLATLRRALRETGAEYKIYKNTLVRRATSDTRHAVIEPMLLGPTAIVFVDADVAAAAKVLRDFARTHPALVVKGSFVGSDLLDARTTAALADLPSRPVLLSQIAGALAAPMRQFASLLKALPQNFAYGLSALVDQRVAGGEALPEVVSEATAVTVGDAADASVGDAAGSSDAAGVDEAPAETAAVEEAPAEAEPEPEAVAEPVAEAEVAAEPESEAAAEPEVAEAEETAEVTEEAPAGGNEDAEGSASEAAVSPPESAEPAVATEAQPPEPEAAAESAEPAVATDAQPSADTE
jgi:large subunit ribosomal protein L10